MIFSKIISEKIKKEKKKDALLTQAIKKRGFAP